MPRASRPLSRPARFAGTGRVPISRELPASFPELALAQPFQQPPEPRRLRAAGRLSRFPEPPQRGLEPLNKSTLDPGRDRAVDEPLGLVGSRGRLRAPGGCRGPGA
jgi:hypothetical protein